MRRSNPTFRSWTKSGLLPFRSLSMYEGAILYLSYLLAHGADRCESFGMSPVASQRQTAGCILYRQPCNDAFADCCTPPGMLQYRRKTGSNRIEG